MTDEGTPPTPADAPAATPSDAPGAVESTTLDVRWVRKMIIMILAAGGFSLWGLYDANVAYPARGVLVSEYHLRDLIRVAKDDSKLARVNTPEPTKEFERLSVGKPVDAFEEAKREWLESLTRVGRLKPEYTTFTDPIAKMNELDAEFAKTPGQSMPSPLSAWDIPVQWGIFGVCGAITVYLLFLYLKVKATRYTWLATDKRLGLPGGHSLVPSDLAEVDKRKWHKFFVTLRIRPGHATLGDRAITLDLYRYAKLEGWVLEMEEASGLAPAEVAPAA